MPHLGQGLKGSQEELRRIAFLIGNGKLSAPAKQPRARGDSQRRDGVDPPALDRDGRGLSSERAHRARCCIKTAVLAVNIEKPTDGSHAQQHLRDCVHEASSADVANAHAGASALQWLPGDLLLGQAVSRHAQISVQLAQLWRPSRIPNRGRHAKHLTPKIPRH